MVARGSQRARELWLGQQLQQQEQQEQQEQSQDGSNFGSWVCSSHNETTVE